MSSTVDNDRPLSGVGVLVTRPSQQADELCSLIKAAGGTAVRFPVLEIGEPEDMESLNRILDRLESYDLAIFISANAVSRALNLIRSKREFPRQLRTAAIGRASARELRRFGLDVDICPSQRFNSEELLAMEPMQQVAGQRIVIFRGEGGRELLADTLTRRGAQVDYAEVYRRMKASPDTADLLRRWGRGEIHVVVATSNEALSHLYELVGKLGRAWLRKTPLVVISDRMLQLARELGFEGEIMVAREPSDQALVTAIGDWRRTHS
jgi:uroporphyrinogen-III synthase